jgi:predicted Zn-dependent protease
MKTPRQPAAFFIFGKTFRKCYFRVMQNRIEVFKQILATDPANTMVLFGLANEYQKIEDWKNTIAALEDYLTKADDEGAAYGMLAKAFERIGEREKARQTYEKGIEVSMAHGHPTMANEYRMTLDLDYGDET